MTEVVPATLADFVAVYGCAPKFTFQGYAVRRDGVAVCICGLYSDGERSVAFIRVNDGVRPRDVVKVANLVLQLAEKRGTPVFAIRDRSLPTSEGFIKHFGFTYAGESPEGEVYQWHR